MFAESAPPSNGVFLFHGPDMATISVDGKTVVITKQACISDPGLVRRHIEQTFGGKVTITEGYTHRRSAIHRPVAIKVRGGQANGAWVTFCDTDGSIRVIERRAHIDDAGRIVACQDIVRMEGVRVVILGPDGKPDERTWRRTAPCYVTCDYNPAALVALNKVGGAILDRGRLV